MSLSLGQPARGADLAERGQDGIRAYNAASRLTGLTYKDRRPDGRVLPDVPPPPEMRGDPEEFVRARNEARGVNVHAHTATPDWHGEPLNVVWAIDVLHPLAR